MAANSVAYDYTSHSNPTADIESLSQSTHAAEADGAALAPLSPERPSGQSWPRPARLSIHTSPLSNEIKADFAAATPAALKAANADVAALAYHTVTEPLGHLEVRVAAHNKSVLAMSSAEAATDRVLVVVLMLVALGLAGGVGAVVTRGYYLALESKRWRSSNKSPPAT